MREVELGEIAEVFGGYAFKSKDFKETPGIPVIKISNIQNGEVSESTLKAFLPENYLGEYENYQISRGDILVALSGATTGKTGIYKLESKSLLNQRVGLVRAKDGKADQKYLSYYVSKITDDILNKAQGVAQPNISTKELSKFKIPLPTLSEQKAIVAKLDHAQRLIDIDRQMLAKYDELIQSVFLEMFGDPVRNEKGWEFHHIADLADDSKYSIKAGPFGSALKKEFYVDDGFKIYGQEQVIRDDFNYGDYYINDQRFKKLQNCEIKKDDVLISLVGSYGYISIVPSEFERGIINPRLMKISFNQKKILPQFFKKLFTNKSFEKLIADQTHGGTMGILNTSIVKKLKIPLPLIDLQRKFLKRVNEIEEQKMLTKKSLKKSEELFSSLVQGVFENKSYQ